MQVTVGNEPLNVRTELPSLNAPNIVYKLPGDVVDIDGNIYKGDLYRGIDTWVKDLAGNYYWSGGLNLFQKWFRDLNIPEIWSYATGKGVGVAIVDTGIEGDIKSMSLAASHFAFDGGGVSDTDGHGTFCGALIGLNSFQDNSVGVAPDAHIFVAKISDTGEFENNELDSFRYANAINWCAKQSGIHIISISWGNPIISDVIKSNVQKAINNAVSNGKIVICAIGDASSFNDNTEFIPVCLENTIGVGSIPISDKLYPFVNKYLSVILNGDNIDSYKINGFPYANYGVSWSNAIFAGLVALIIQKMNFKYTYLDIQRIITALIVDTEYTIDSITKSLPTLDSDKLLNFFKTT